MTRHSAVRQAIIAALKKTDDGSTTFFDGRPVVVEEDELPAVAVYLSDAQYTGTEVDGDIWSAVLHVEVFLKATAPDSALDEQMENRVYPALGSVAGRVTSSGQCRRRGITISGTMKWRCGGQPI